MKPNDTHDWEKYSYIFNLVLETGNEAYIQEWIGRIIKN